ncbi:Endoribonuclease L-PSP/chorismate mutase-like protein [Aspergillus filifer]
MTTHLSKPFLLDPSTPLGPTRYAHARTIQTGSSTTMYISGIAAVTPAGKIEGITTHPDGSYKPDVRAQTSAVLNRIEAIIKGASENKAGLSNIVDATVYLVDMERDYSGFNEVWNGVYKTRESAPTRATVEVGGLPDKRLVVEVKAIAVF